MSILEWILVLSSLAIVLLGVVILLGKFPTRWKGQAEPTREGVFFRRFIGVVFIVYGLEGLLNALAPLMGLLWRDTHGIIGISLFTLWFLTMGIALLTGMSLTSANMAGGNAWQLLTGIMFIMFAVGFFMDAMGHKLSREWMESAGESVKLVALLLWIILIAKRESKVEGSSQNG